MISARAALGAAVLLTASGGAFAQKKGGDVVIAITQAPPSLDAQVTSAQAARNITLHIYETLYARDENAKPVPELAEGVKISDDGKTYVFPIRKGVKFHNGKELDAKDVVASLERYRKVGASAPLLGAVDKVTATGPNEVTVTLKDVQSTFLDNLSSPRAPIAIYPAEEAAKPANQINYHRHRALPFRRIQARQPRQDRALRRLRAQPQGDRARRLRGQEGSVPRHRHFPVHA